MTSPAPVAVVGGGISGLAAALALAQAGVNTSLYEQSAKFEEVGAG
ncbi:MAG: FAD-dependent oxidoreductase, partial [Betaproteobacteria bacterium]|nr:FAD-dependent oxidoreductase [Betaproteobacteria bacterium]